MLFCARKYCPSGEEVQFDMTLSCLKWRVKNFTDGDIYASVGERWDAESNMRIPSGREEILVDRDPKTGTRRSSRCLSVYAAKAGEVEISLA